MNQRQQLFNYIATQYCITPEYLWEKFPNYAVFHHSNKKAKWFALIANVPKTKLGLTGEGNAEILNLKGDPEMISLLRQDPNVLPAYHMNKTHWFTIVLDSGFSTEEIVPLLDCSYRLTK